jgi:hypothetical protein
MGNHAETTDLLQTWENLKITDHRWVLFYDSMFWVGLGPAFYRTDGSQTTKIKLCNVLIVSALAIHGETANG